MGMYDIVDGYQVKCFKIPAYYGQMAGEYGIGFMGGSLKSFFKEDEVPYKTWWYDYTRDFNVVDTDDEDILYKIRDGKVLEVKCGDIGEDDFSGINLCVGYHGTMLHIKSFQEFEQFFENCRECSCIYKENAAGYQEALSEANRSRRVDPKSIRFGNVVRQKELLDERMRPYKEQLLDPYIYTDTEAMAKEGLFGGFLNCIEFHTGVLQCQNEKDDLVYHRNALIGCMRDYQKLCERVDYSLFDSFAGWSKVCVDEINRILRDAREEIL